MDHIRPAPPHRLFSGLAEVIQPTLAQKINLFVRQIGPYISGHDINEGPKFTLAAPDSLFRTRAISHINYRTYKFAEISRRAGRRVAYHVDIPGLAVRVNDSVVHLEVRLIADGIFEPLPGRGFILGMNPLEESFESR